jgi:hypothetical protein
MERRSQITLLNDRELIIMIIRIITVFAIIGIVVWDRHALMSNIFGIVGSNDWVGAILAGCFVSLSIVLADHLIWRIISRLTSQGFISTSESSRITDHAAIPLSTNEQARRPDE